MKEKRDIVENWLPRYTGTPLDEFGQYVLLTNFGGYVAWFAAHHDVPIKGADRSMPNVTADGIILIKFRHGKSECRDRDGPPERRFPKGCFISRKCGGLKRKNQTGDLILPIAAIRGEGTSNDYLPPEGVYRKLKHGRSGGAVRSGWRVNK